LIKITC